LKKYYGTEKPSALKTIGGFGVSAAGMGADIATNPADVLSLLIGKTPIGKGRTLAETAPIQAVGRFLGKERSLEPLAKKMPKIMGEKWLEGQAKLAQKTAGGLEGMRSAAYENIYNKLNKAKVPQVEVSDILQKYDLIDEVGVPHIEDIKSLKAFSDELSAYVPQQIKVGKVFGKGGFGNPKIRAQRAASEIKDLIYKAAEEGETVGTVEKGIASQLKSLDPRAEKIRGIGGYSPEPETSGVAGAYKILMGSEGASGKRLAIKRAPQALKELKPYIASEKGVELSKAIQTSKQLAKDMGKYRSRQLIKAIGTGGGGILLADYLLRRIIGKQVLGGGRGY
jgi:hypothetical protein